MDGYDYIADFMKVLGHPARLQILQALRQEEACVCHLEKTLGQRQAYISQHLMKLREAGLVIDRREGTNVFYSLASRRVGDLIDAVTSAAISIAAYRQETLVFAPLTSDGSETCTCPACTSSVSSMPGNTRRTSAVLAP